MRYMKCAYMTEASNVLSFGLRSVFVYSDSANLQSDEENWNKRNNDRPTQIRCSRCVRCTRAPEVSNYICWRRT